MTREIRFSPAWDERTPDPRTNRGIHGVDMWWYLTGPKGVIQFGLSTNWYLPQSQQSPQNPLPFDLGYHSPGPMHECQTAMDCHLLPGGRCYYDGSTLNAYPVYEILLREGSEGVWKFLEGHYKAIFETVDAAVDRPALPEASA